LHMMQARLFKTGILSLFAARQDLTATAVRTAAGVVFWASVCLVYMPLLQLPVAAQPEVWLPGPVWPRAQPLISMEPYAGYPEIWPTGTRLQGRPHDRHRSPELSPLESTRYRPYAAFPEIWPADLDDPHPRPFESTSMKLWHTRQWHSGEDYSNKI